MVMLRRSKSKLNNRGPINDPWGTPRADNLRKVGQMKHFLTIFHQTSGCDLQQYKFSHFKVPLNFKKMCIYYKNILLQFISRANTFFPQIQKMGSKTYQFFFWIWNQRCSYKVEPCASIRQ